MDLRFGAADDALRLSREVLEKDLKHLNDLRSEVVSDRLTFITKDYYTIEHKSLEKQIKDVHDKVITIEARHDIKNRNMWIALAISVIVSLITLIKEFVK